MRRSPGRIALWLAALAFYLAAHPAGGQTSLLGRWQGVALIKPAEFEVGVEVTFSRGDDGAMSGVLSFTTNGDFNRPVHSISVDRSRARFAVTDDDGVVSAFDGSISEDGNWLTGDLEERGTHYLFKLQRAGLREKPGTPQGLRRLSPSGSELVDLFNRDRSRVRLLLVLSSSCPVCKSGVGIVQRYVLDEIDDPRLAVYVVWESVIEKDTEGAALAAGRFIDDPRVVQFWAGNRFAGQAFERSLGSKGVPVWDVYLVFSAGDRWADMPPAPAFVMSNMVTQEVQPKDPRLNGPELARKISAALAASGGGPVRASATKRP